MTNYDMTFHFPNISIIIREVSIEKVGNYTLAARRGKFFNVMDNKTEYTINPDQLIFIETKPSEESSWYGI